MTSAHRFLSLSMLGAMAFAVAPLAGAQGLNEEIRTELQACRDNNESHEDRKACARAVAEQYNFELPARRGRKIGKKIGHTFRSSITETCGERENSDEWKACAKETRKGTLQELREQHPRATRRFAMRRRFKNLDEDGREALKACRTLETRDEKKACFDDIRENLDTE